MRLLDNLVGRSSNFVFIEPYLNKAIMASHDGWWYKLYCGSQTILSWNTKCYQALPFVDFMSLRCIPVCFYFSNKMLYRALMTALVSQCKGSHDVQFVTMTTQSMLQIENGLIDYVFIGSYYSSNCIDLLLLPKRQDAGLRFCSRH